MGEPVDETLDLDFQKRSQRHYNDYLLKKQQKGRKVDENFVRPQVQGGEKSDSSISFSEEQVKQKQPKSQTKAPVAGFQWVAKPTKEGFLYFSIPGTNTYQWAFPKIYDSLSRQNKYLFISHWVKEIEETPSGPAKVWRHKTNPHFKQSVKPFKETYLIESAIEGNLAFLEVYGKF